MWTNNKKAGIDFNNFPDLARKKKKVLKLLDKNQTPMFIVDKEILLDRLDNLKSGLEKYSGNYQIGYSFKTNYEIAKLNIFKKSGCWAEVVSGKEYKMAKKFGFKGSQIIFNGPYKTNKELALALRDKALIFVDNLQELNRIIEIAQIQNRHYSMGLRINTKIPYLEQSRFGFSIDNKEAKEAIKRLNSSKLLKLSGFHIHLGSDIDNPISYKVATKSLCKFINNEIPDSTANIKTLDFGGGFPASGLTPYGKKKWNPQTIQKYLNVITKELKDVFRGETKPTLILEPGRYLVDDAVIFITKVVANNNRGTSNEIIVNSTVNMLPLVWYRPQIAKVYNSSLNIKKTNKKITKIYGSSCQEADLLYTGILPFTKEGDFLILYCVGAYNEAMGSNFIFEKPKVFLI